jgi:RNA recognition motif-containing protein
MTNKLFVGGIAWASTEDSLKQFFSQVGEVVEVKIIKDRQTGKSKGFGFVTMATAEEAEKAINELNNQDLDGRKLRVSEALPQKKAE